MRRQQHQHTTVIHEHSNFSLPQWRCPQAQAATVQHADLLVQLAAQHAKLQQQIDDTQQLLGALQGVAAKQFAVSIDAVGQLKQRQQKLEGTQAEAALKLRKELQQALGKQKLQLDRMGVTLQAMQRANSSSSSSGGSSSNGRSSGGGSSGGGSSSSSSSNSYHQVTASAVPRDPWVTSASPPSSSTPNVNTVHSSSTTRSASASTSHTTAATSGTGRSKDNVEQAAPLGGDASNGDSMRLSGNREQTDTAASWDDTGDVPVSATRDPAATSPAPGPSTSVQQADAGPDSRDPWQARTSEPSAAGSSNADCSKSETQAAAQPGGAARRSLDWRRALSAE